MGSRPTPTAISSECGPTERRVVSIHETGVRLPPFAPFTPHQTSATQSPTNQSGTERWQSGLSRWVANPVSHKGTQVRILPAPPFAFVVQRKNTRLISMKRRFDSGRAHHFLGQPASPRATTRGPWPRNAINLQFVLGSDACAALVVIPELDCRISSSCFGDDPGVAE